jgi:hypothetical protein
MVGLKGGSKFDDVQLKLFRFGSLAYFCLRDPRDLDFSSLRNLNLNAGINQIWNI